MARKKAEIQLQVEIETQEEWEEMLAKEGLTVIDVYQEWCGPCKPMTSIFRRVKNELGDDLLRFAMAKSDTVDALEKYRGKCKPCFLFFAGGVLVSAIREAMSPQIIKTITEQLAQEHRVLDGAAERKEIRDEMVGDTSGGQKFDDDEDEEGDDESDGSKSLPDEKELKKGVTVAILKPSVVESGKVEEIIQKMEEHGIEVLEAIDKQMTEEEAREFYEHKKDEPFFEDLIKHMTSGPSKVLVLSKGETGDMIIEEWRELLGPTSVEEAKEKAPESLRAQYGVENYVNAVHGSDSESSAMRELAFFFPDYVRPTIHKEAKPKIQRTLALIRPDAMAEKKDEILAKIAEAGFTIALQKMIQLTKEQAEQFYEEHRDQPYFDTLATRMSSGPLLALALARSDAVTGWREMLGPKEVDKAKEEAPDSLRAMFSEEGAPVNPLHGSDSEETAKKELDYFFPMQQTVAVIKPDAHQTKDEIMDKIKEAGFHIAARKETQIEKSVAEQFYKDQSGKEFYGDLTEHMSSGPTLFMVLSREDAVDGWRSLIGPTDPEKAKEEAPESLRAQFGQDVKANAVHGSSDPEKAKESMKLIFGDMEFNQDGSPAGQETTEAPAAKSPEATKTEEPAAAAEPEAATEEAASAEQTEAKGEEAAPAADETPAAEESEQTPAAEESEQAPATEEASASEQAPAEEEAPATEQAPAADDAPAAEEQKSTEEAEKSAEESETPAKEGEAPASEQTAEGADAVKAGTPVADEEEKKE